VPSKLAKEEELVRTLFTQVIWQKCPLAFGGPGAQECFRKHIVFEEILRKT
jgi:hypothetical protein